MTLAAACDGGREYDRGTLRHLLVLARQRAGDDLDAGPSAFDAEGKLLAVLAKNYIAYSNASRLNLLALGLRPDRPAGPLATCQACGAGAGSLAEYLAHRSVCTAAPTAAPAPAGATIATTDAPTPSSADDRGADGEVSR